MKFIEVKDTGDQMYIINVKAIKYLQEVTYGTEIYLRGGKMIQTHDSLEAFKAALDDL